MSAPEVEAVREEYERVLMEVRIELQDSEAERKRLLRKTKALQTELTKQRAKDAETHGDREFFDLWVRECRKHPKRTAFDEDRQKVIRKARQLYDSDEGDALCRRAIVGVGKFPYVVDGRRSASGASSQRYDDLELILRNAGNIEKFARLVDAPQDEPAPKRELAEPRKREHPLGANFDPIHELSNAMAKAGCKMRGNPYHHGRYVGQCPAHEDRDPSLSIEERGGRVLLYCHAGCSAKAILEALGLEWCHLFHPDFDRAEIVKNFPPPPEGRKVFDQLGIDWSAAP